MNKAYKFRIYPNELQRKKIEKTFNCVRFIYNKMLTDRLEYYRETGKILRNTPAQYKQEFSWLKEVDSLALANAQMHLQAAYENFFKNPKLGLPKFKSRKRSKKCYTTNFVYGNIVIRQDEIKLPKMGFIRMKQHRDIPADYKLKAVTVSQNSKGNYYASVLFEYETEEKEVVSESMIQLEYSEKGLYVEGSGVQIDYPVEMQQTLKKIRQEKQKLLHMKKGSKNREKQRIKIVKIKEKFYRQRDDFLHKQSRQITNAYDIVCIKEPDEGVSGDFGWQIFKNFLRYKLSEEGKRLIGAENIVLSKMLYSHQAV